MSVTYGAILIALLTTTSGWTASAQAPPALPAAGVLLCAYGTAQLPPPNLGTLSVETFEGQVFLQERAKDFVLELVGRNPQGGVVVVGGIDAWLLLDDGKAATLRQKAPKTGRAIEINKGRTAEAHVLFTFASARQVMAVVIRVGDRFHVFKVSDNARTTGSLPLQHQSAGSRTGMSDDAKRLLATLRKRLDEIAAASESGEGRKRGGDLDLRPLMGLQRETLRGALGHASINCRDKPAVNVTTGERVRIAPCQADEDLVYSFYRWPKGTAGGGPELLLEFNQNAICIRALWRTTQ